MLNVTVVKPEDKIWAKLEKSFASQEPQLLEIWGSEEETEFGEPAFVVWFEGYLKGYIPFSESGVESVQEMDFFLGSKVPAVATTLIREKELIGFSVKKAKAKLEPETRKNLKVGDIMVGIVERLSNTRAIVNIGGVEAEMMPEDVSWTFFRYMNDALKLGEAIEVKVIEIGEVGTVRVSKKAVEEDPWKKFTRQVRLNQKCIATVSGHNGMGGIYLRFQNDIYGMAKRSKPLPVGTRVVVTVSNIADNKRIHCNITRVID